MRRKLGENLFPRRRRAREKNFVRAGENRRAAGFGSIREQSD
jgi:hypothetical protein